DGAARVDVAGCAILRGDSGQGNGFGMQFAVLVFEFTHEIFQFPVGCWFSSSRAGSTGWPAVSSGMYRGAFWPQPKSTRSMKNAAMDLFMVKSQLINGQYPAVYPARQSGAPRRRSRMNKAMQDLSESEFNQQVDLIQDRIEQALDAADLDLEMEQAEGSLILMLAAGPRLVIGRQPASRELWVAT